MAVNNMGHLLLSLCLPLMHTSTAHLLVWRLQEVGLVEPHRLAADRHTMRLAQPLGLLRIPECQQTTQVAQRVAAVATAVPVAVEEQQLTTDAYQVAVEGAALQEVQPAGQAQKANWVAFTEGPAYGQCKAHGRGRADVDRELQCMLHHTCTA